MADNVIGEATIVVGADASDFSEELDKQLPEAGEKSGSKMSSALGTALKGGAAVAGGAVATVLGMGIAQGFSRLNSIDQAEAKLKGLGHSTDEVKNIMDSALASVKGTAFGLGDAAMLAATAVASGVQPGEALTRQLKVMADTATIAGVPLMDMSDIFGDVNASGKATGETFSRLQERGIPAVQMLSKHLGISMEEAQKKIKDGEVDVDSFIATLESGFGGAALKSGETFSGAMNNVKAAMGRLGATVLGPVFEKLPGIMDGLIKKFDAAAPAAKKVGELIGDAFAWISEQAAKLKPSLDTLWDRFIAVSTTLWHLFQDDLLPVIQAVFGWIVDHKTALTDVATVILSMVAAWKLWNLAITAWTAITRVATAVQVAWDAAMAANPVGLIVIAIVGLIAAMVLLYNRSEGFRSFVIGMWEGIKNTIGPIINTIKSFFSGLFGDGEGAGGAVGWGQKVRDVFQQISQTVGKAMSEVWNWIKNVWDKIGPYVMGALSLLWMLWSKYFQLYWTVVREVMEKVWQWIKFIWENIVPIWVKYLQIIWEVVSTVFMAVWRVIMWVWENVVPAVVNYVRQMWSVITTVFNFIKGVVETVMTAIGFVIRTVMATVQWIWENVLSKIWSVASTVFTTVFNIVSTIFNAIWNVISTVLRTVWNIVSTIFNAIATVIGFVMNVVWTIIRTIWGVIGPFVTGVLREIWNNVVTAFNGIKAVIEVVMNVVKTIISAIWSAIQWVWENVLSRLWSTAVSIFNTVKNAIGDAMGWVQDKIQTVLNVVHSIWENVFMKVWNTTRDIFDQVKDKIQGALDTVRNLFQGAVDAIGNIWNKVTDVVKAPINDMFKWINEHMIDPINSVLGKFSAEVTLRPLPTFHSGGYTGEQLQDEEGLALLRNDEFVLNPYATSMYRPLAEAMNAGQPIGDAIAAAAKGYGIGGPGTAAQIYGWLKAQGLSDAGAAGVLGNIQAESGFDPGAVEGNGAGHGLVQWSFSRWDDLQAFASARNASWSDLSVQLGFLAQEISNGYGGMWNSLKGMSDPVAASRLFADQFERPGTYGERDSYATSLFQRMQSGQFNADTSDQSLLGQIVGMVKSAVGSLVHAVTDPALGLLKSTFGNSWAGKAGIGLFEQVINWVTGWADKQSAPSGSGGSSYGGVAGAWRIPLEAYDVTSEYGMRVSPTQGGEPVLHAGIDLGAPEGTNVLAAAAGQIMQSGWAGGYGNFVAIDHGQGLQTQYGHMLRTLVQAGQIVAMGDVVGQVDSTGDSTGNHLHFNTLTNGQYENPRDFMGARGLSFDSGGMLPQGWTAAYNGTGKPEPVLTGDQFRKMSGPGTTINIVNNYPQAEPTSVTTSRALRMMSMIGEGV